MSAGSLIPVVAGLAGSVVSAGSLIPIVAGTVGLAGSVVSAGSLIPIVAGTLGLAGSGVSERPVAGYAFAIVGSLFLPVPSAVLRSRLPLSTSCETLSMTRFLKSSLDDDR